MHDWLIETWYGGTRRGLWLRPLAAVYVLAAALDRALYRLGLRRAYRATIPVVVIGNVTVGGTGKTPLVLWLAERLRERGLRVGVVSRGYGRRGAAARRVTRQDPPAEVGDEPALVSRRLGVAVAVAAARPDAARLLEGDCDLILSDDGLQHHALARDAEIAVVDGRRGLGNGWRLPAGPLREAASRLDRVGAVVVNGEGYSRPGALRMDVEPIRFVELATGRAVPPAAFAGQRAHAVAALGHPERFFALLRQLEVEPVEHRFRDHHAFSPADVAFGDALPVLMTEKDAVKCTGFAPPGTWCLEIGARFAAEDERRLLAVIEGALRARR
ncbi:MAG: tetraacyldisaccharide 4'-kinase [Steroidobacteraceae bacterium]|nr:tetraacyldisaccharide 4'-kinase [Steroidobacteraceae bacterium]